MGQQELIDMSVVHTNRPASAAEIVSEMDRRGAVIEKLESRIAALEAQVEGMRELETRMRDAGLPGFADHIRRIVGDRAALQSSETTGEQP